MHWSSSSGPSGLCALTPCLDIPVHLRPDRTAPRSTTPCWTSPCIYALQGLSDLLQHPLDFPTHLRPSWTSLAHYNALLDFPTHYEALSGLTCSSTPCCTSPSIYALNPDYQTLNGWIHCKYIYRPHQRIIWLPGIRDSQYEWQTVNSVPFMQLCNPFGFSMLYKG